MTWSFDGSDNSKIGKLSLRMTKKLRLHIKVIFDIPQVLQYPKNSKNIPKLYDKSKNEKKKDISII